ncbi:MAG: aminopeptidase N [Deltaproteobacteria bacterium]|nr:aminopeptidase N [Deltaproteobacteria bacterium]
MNTPSVKYLKDYKQLPYNINSIDLTFEIHDEFTMVNSILKIAFKEDNLADRTLEFNGKSLELISVSIDNETLNEFMYDLKDEKLLVKNVPVSFQIEIKTKLLPHENTSLEGLYKSGAMLCTQCEAEGFRQITFFPDRPDVMTKYTVRIEADKTKFPVLLSNGNLKEKGELEENRHFALWEDPHKKPSYLFALVAGDLLVIKGNYTTVSGRDVLLEIYIEKGNEDKCEHAMNSLIKSMKWDEDVFGREYDLDIYMIVAVNDFNAGAMENKGLNVFNSKYVLADTVTATDDDYYGVESVIGHEYFHNWTGNRVTLKNWFQLSLKEGLTVYRHQRFAQEMALKDIERIKDVKKLREHQFPEDAGPMAHPVRPDNYIEIDNFYTMTVYEKGAEVIRMIYTMLGKEVFRDGMDLYFEKFDGMAVTTEDFVSVMEEVSGKDLTQFKLWYSNAGTPEINAIWHYNEAEKFFSLELTQKCPDTPNQTDKNPMHIPITVALIDCNGNDMEVRSKGEFLGQTSFILDFTQEKQIFEFEDVMEKPVLSILRDFSAPVKLTCDYSEDELVFLMANDSDNFNRWEAAQRLFFNLILKLIKDYQNREALKMDNSVISAVKKVLTSSTLDKNFIALTLTLPSEIEIGDRMGEIDVEAVYKVRKFIRKRIAGRLNTEFLKVYINCQDRGEYNIDPESVGKRKLKNLALSYLSTLELPSMAEKIYNQFRNATNMTDEISALSLLANMKTEKGDLAINEFYEKWKDNTLVLDKWFAVQASSTLPGTFNVVNSLLEHEAFSIKNPNKVRSLIGVFANANPINFHTINGYSFLADQVIILNKLNPMIAARLVSVFNKWKRYDTTRKNLMKTQLERILSTENLSKNVYEIVTKALA